MNPGTLLPELSFLSAGVFNTQDPFGYSEFAFTYVNVGSEDTNLEMA